MCCLSGIKQLYPIIGTVTDPNIPCPRGKLAHSVVVFALNNRESGVVFCPAQAKLRFRWIIVSGSQKKRNLFHSTGVTGHSLNELNWITHFNIFFTVDDCHYYYASAIHI